MKLQQKLKMIWEKPSNIYHYFLGNYRYWLYYSKYVKLLMRRHIIEQIEWRVKVMDRDCFENGSCKVCGCETIHLQMANKPCGKPCYPAMMNEHKWKAFNNGSVFVDKNGTWVLSIKLHKLQLLKMTKYGYFAVVPNNEDKLGDDKAKASD